MISFLTTKPKNNMKNEKIKIYTKVPNMIEAARVCS